MIRRILLIDDDNDDAVFFADALQEVNDTTIFDHIHDGREALRKIAKAELQLPDIIFLDVNMPVVDGWDCLAIIKEQPSLQQVPVIMYSTSNHITEITRAAEMGATAYWTKPYTIGELRHKLANLLRNPDML